MGSVASLGHGRVLRNALVLDVSDKAVLVVGGVGDDLGATVREKDIVFSICGITISSFILAKVNT